MLERIRSRRVLLGDCDNLVIKPAELSIAGGLITGIRPLESDAGNAPAGEHDVLDLGDHFVTPAFVNSHTHLALSFLRGVDASRFQHNLVEDLYFHFENQLSADDIRAFARMGAYESLMAGVGSVWEHYYGDLALAEALLDTGLTGVIAPTLQDLAGPGVKHHERALTATLEIATSERHRDAFVFAAMGPHATDTVSAALLRQVAQTASSHDLPVHMHVAQSVAELQRVHARERCSPLALLQDCGLLEQRLILAHAIFCPEADLKRLDATRHTLVFCPSSQLQFGLPADVTRWSRAAARFTVATDCASSNDGMSLQKELRYCLGAATYRHTGSATYARFLESGELSFAEQTWAERMQDVQEAQASCSSSALLGRVLSTPGSLHPGFRSGTIEVGALANLVAWNVEHPAWWPASDLLRGLAVGDVMQSMHTLVIRGRLLGEVGFPQALLQTATYREHLHEAQQRLAHLLRA